LRINKKKFIYLISPNKIINNNFFKDLKLILSKNKISFFQLRLKKQSLKQKIIISKKIIKLCKKYKVKFIINDNPYLALKVNADGCHLGQNDMDIENAKKILKNKLIGITCHNSIRLAKNAEKAGASYVAFGSFFSTKTKKVSFKASLRTLNSFRKISKIPIVGIGGINNKNYKKLLLNKVNFLAISSFIWKNKKYKPHEAIKKLI
tara:strand:+ start:1326 stop:1943 length:618 start_codon:yes stop_codon:yes gene_type:complete